MTEKFLKLPSGKDAKKVKNAYEWAVSVKTEDIPKQFIKLKEFIGESICKSNEPKEEVEVLDEIPF